MSLCFDIFQSNFNLRLNSPEWNNSVTVTDAVIMIFQGVCISCYAFAAAAAGLKAYHKRKTGVLIDLSCKMLFTALGTSVATAAMVASQLRSFIKLCIF